MNSSYFNALAGALLAVVFVVMTVSIASDAIYHTREPVQEGFEIAVTEGGPATGGETEDEGLEPIAPLLASASIEGGVKAFKKCAACHTPDEGGANRVGPNLWNIVDRPVAEVPGFAYSKPMIDFAKGGETLWTYENLNHFLENPKKFISKTKMNFGGVRKPGERADLIAYLRSLSDSPAPLPSPEESAASETETPAATEASASGSEATDGTAEPADTMSTADETDKPAEGSESSD